MPVHHTIQLRIIDSLYRISQWWANTETAYCPETHGKTYMKSTGAKTGDPYTCSECGHSFGIHPTNAAREFTAHVEKSKAPPTLYRFYATTTNMIKNIL